MSNLLPDGYVDLHIHTHHSDGTLSPSQVVEIAGKKKLSAIAISDHDSVAGIDEASSAASACGIELISAIELSVQYGSHKDVHLLGYSIDHHDSLLQKKLDEFAATRDTRVVRILERVNRRLLRERLSAISYEEVIEHAAGTLGRPHIARVLVAKGYARNNDDAFERYLVPCDVPKPYFPIQEALAEIRRVGGVAVLAHPTTITSDPNQLAKVVTELVSLGLDGLEVFNNLCYKDEMAFLQSLAVRQGLVMTGGSDFHTLEEENEIGSGRGGLAVPYDSVVQIKNLASGRKYR